MTVVTSENFGVTGSKWKGSAAAAVQKHYLMNCES